MNRKRAGRKPAQKAQAIYKLRPLFDPARRQAPPDVADSPLHADAECYVEGEIGRHVVVSVPVSLTPDMLDVFRDGLMRELKRPVLLIGHNTTFLAAQRLSAKQTRAILARVNAADARDKAEVEHEARGCAHLRYARDALTAEIRERYGEGCEDLQAMLAAVEADIRLREEAGRI